MAAHGRGPRRQQQFDQLILDGIGGVEIGRPEVGGRQAEFLAPLAPVGLAPLVAGFAPPFAALAACCAAGTNSGAPWFSSWMELLLVSFDSTIKANLSVALPLDYHIYTLDSCTTGTLGRIKVDDSYFETISNGWGVALRDAFGALPDFKLPEGE